jgi:ribosomal-protein-alanine N-acetyltransferase
VRYRPYAAADFAALYALEQACFAPSERFSRRLMRQLIAAPCAATWVADCSVEDAEEKLAGFAVVEWSHEIVARAAYLHTLEVGARHRRQGVGAALLLKTIASAQAAGASLFWLHVAEANAAALGLYRAQGFLPQGREENYYGSGQHALLCSLALPDLQAMEKLGGKQVL